MSAQYPPKRTNAPNNAQQNQAANHQQNSSTLYARRNVKNPKLNRYLSNPRMDEPKTATEILSKQVASCLSMEPEESKQENYAL